MANTDNKVGTRLKTNMMMEVKLSDDFSIKITHKDGKSVLQDIFDYGNTLRVARGRSEIRMSNWLQRENTCEFIIAHEKLTYGNLKCRQASTSKSGIFQVVGPLCSLNIGTSRVNKTRADLLLTLKAAATLDAELEVLIYTVFIKSGILDLRDKGGDNFKKLNTAIDRYMPGREGKSSNKGLYINAAKKIRKGLGCESLADWNVQAADAKSHEFRTDIEQRLIILLENGMVEGTQHLWQLIEKQCKLVQE
jgi:hypothetical protein